MRQLSEWVIDRVDFHLGQRLRKRRSSCRSAVAQGDGRHRGSKISVRRRFPGHRTLPDDDLIAALGTWNQTLETGEVVVSRKVAIDIDAEAVRES